MMNPRPQGERRIHHEINTNTGIPPPVLETSCSSDCSTNVANASQPRGYNPPRPYTPQRRGSLTTEALAGYLNSGRISHADEGRSNRPRARGLSHDTLGQVGRGQELPRHRGQSTQPSPLYISTRRGGREATPQISSPAVAHHPKSSAPRAPHMATDAEQQRLGTNEPALTPPRRTVHFNPFTTEYGGGSGPETGIISPLALHAPVEPKIITAPPIPMQKILDMYGDLLPCYQ